MPRKVCIDDAGDSWHAGDLLRVTDSRHPMHDMVSVVVGLDCTLGLVAIRDRNDPRRVWWISPDYQASRVALFDGRESRPAAEDGSR
jgi:hypothetical protein